MSSFSPAPPPPTPCLPPPSSPYPPPPLLFYARFCFSSKLVFPADGRPEEMQAGERHGMACVPIHAPADLRALCRRAERGQLHVAAQVPLAPAAH